MTPPENDPSPPSQALELRKEAVEELARDEYVKYSESFILLKRKEEKLYPFKESELDRIQQLISKIVPQHKIFQILWPMTAGIGATAAFALLAFLTVGTAPTTLWIIGFVTVFVSLILTFIFLLLDSREPDRITGSVTAALGELRFVREQFEHPELPQE